MELKIGVQHAQRELVIDTAETPESIGERLSEALSKGDVFSVTDTKGRTVLVPSEKIAYAELGTGTTGTVGFR